ncbi:hypothetical protein QQ020_23835 [Fulvivirgaceae bacterium BMA12]|uniref:DUF4825 domain-containing protein n=1 Tax=Agaribacillus aureus TaxID=3051825 RepID=A0ABT8LFR3_9BACT|nr:hypothetical protein [Fulvivirgaceae bacterium BMA12]
MKNFIAAVIMLISFESCSQRTSNETLTEFRKTDSERIIATHYLKSYQHSHKEALVGDFLSKLWFNFGETKDYGYDGYTYAIEHIPTGIVFSAYNGSAGPSFGGFEKDKESLSEILNKFELLLKQSNYADCELTFNTDYGELSVGAKNGTPFEKSAE